MDGKEKATINNVTKQYKRYWDSYYTKGLVSIQASGFARFALSYMQPGGHVIDLGCGNGRDSLFFAQNEMKVTAVDISQTAIETVRQGCGDLPVITLQDDFVKSKALFEGEYDYCYSRWTLHTIDDLQQAEFIKNVWSALKDDGLFFVEARTIRDDIYGMGQNVGAHAYIYDEHYRRFIDSQDFAKRLKEQNYEVLHFEEDRGFSKTEESDPVLLRVTAKKLRCT